MKPAQSDPITLTPQNPWPGMREFREEDRFFFFGRDRETRELVDLVERAHVIVLYGQSGLGKTSLLQAGLFPRLRELALLPIRVRLTHAENTPPLAEQMKTALAEELDRADISGPRPQGHETLWEYFHRTDLDFWGARNRLITPFIVLDQFEEAFTLGQKNATLGSRVDDFAAELEALLEQRPPSQVRQHLEDDGSRALQYDLDRRTVKLAITLREDFLANLDTWRARMPSLMAYRFRLEAMTAAQALDVVTGAGGALLAPEVPDAIVEFVSDSKRLRGARGTSAHRRIEPALLSLVCDELNRRRIQRDQTTITRDLLSAGGEMEQIVQTFYEDAFAGIDVRVREWIEDELLTSSGHRDRAALEDAERSDIPVHALDILEKRRILHREDRDGCVWLELTHDLLTDPATESRDARRNRKEMESAALQRGRLQLRIREELTRPTPDTVRHVCDAADALASSALAEPESPGSVASSAAYLALAAEALCDRARFDLAADYAGRAKAMLSTLAQPSDDTAAGAARFAEAQCSYVLGCVAIETSTLAEAADHLQRALELTTPPFEGSFGSDLVRVAFLAQIRLGVVDYRRGRPAEARAQLEQVLSGLESGATQIVRGEVDTWRITTLYNLASIREGREARETLDQADILLSGLLAADPTNRRWLRLSARLSEERGEKALHIGQQEAAEFFERSLAHSTALSDSKPDDLDWSLCVVKSLYGLGHLHTSREDWDRALDTLDRARRMNAAVVQSHPTWNSAGHESAIVQWHLGRLFEARSARLPDRREKDLETAASHYEKGRGILEQIATRVPDNVNIARGVALFAGQLGLIRAAAGKRGEALDRYAQSLAVLEGLSDSVRAAPDMQEVEVYFLDLAGDALLEEKRPVEAIAHYTRAADTRRAIALASTESPLQFEYLAQLHVKIAQAHAQMGHHDLAASAYELAVSAVDRAIVASGAVETPQPGERSHSDLLRHRAHLKERLASVWIERADPSRAAETVRDAAAAWLELWNQLPWDEAAQKSLARIRDEATKLGETSLRKRIDAALELLPDDVEVRRGVRVATRPQNWALLPTVPGMWRTLGPDEHLRELARIKVLAPQAGEILTPDCVRRMRLLPLACYENASLWEAEVQSDPDRRDIVAYVRMRDEVTVLDGKSASIQRLNETAPLRLDTPDRAAAYLLLFANSLQAELGRFVIVEHLGSVNLSADAPSDLRRDLEQSIRPLVVNRGAGGEWTATGTIQYGDGLFYASFRIKTGGRVEMAEDVPFAPRLPIFAEYFIRGVRMLMPGQQLRVDAHLFGWRAQWREAAEALHRWIEFVERDFETSALPTKQVLLSAYGDLAWYSLHARDFAAALDAAEAGMRVVEDSAPVARARAHALLFLDRIQEAEEWYGKFFELASRSELAAPKRTLLEDLEALEQNGLTHPGFARIREIAANRVS